MQRTPRSNAGNRYKDVLRSLTGGSDRTMNKQTLTFSSPLLATAEEAHVSPMLHDPSPPPISDQRVHVRRETPLSVKPSRHPKSTTSIQSEIEQLEAQCEHLNLELRKAKLEKEQSNLTKALVVELQALPSKEAEQTPISGIQIKKAKQITDYLFLTSLDSIEEEGHIVEIGGGARIQIDRKKTPLSHVTLEQWGFASLGILTELIRTDELSPLETKGYLSYTQSIFRLVANHIWHSVLLYDKEYRDLQAKEGFKWGDPQKDLRDFHLVPKNNSLTMRTLSAMNKSSPSENLKENPGSKQNSRKRGPFMPDGREICRKFNSGTCEFQRCRMAHNCAICYSRDHKAVEHNSKNEVRKPQTNSTA
ncbi:unnamed protein product [Mytilus edulis]|uniref:C3H1-type domain-containing protein n=2 Tax=Mytilus TaxID=6548 RepID=A0A8B6H9R2_MYTGA|nr:unnamed protein product [Mytilus edulis]VDI76567.1 Hypothetical predicted protein [Mytilus galloprovincialis]